MQPRRSFVSLPDGEVSVLEWGSAQQARRAPIHFSHANGFNAQTYDALLGPLAQDRLVYSSDLRGHGHSRLPANPATHKSWTVYAADLCALLDKLPGGPFVLAGHSMGATASLLAAAARPDLVKGLILAEPVIMPARVRWMMRAAQALGFYDRVMPLAAQAEKRRKTFQDTEGAFAAYRGRGAFKTWPDRMVRDYLTGGLLLGGENGAMRLACDPAWEAANYRAGPPSVWTCLPNITCQIALLTGGRRSTCPEPVAKALKRNANRLSWLHFPDCTHFLPMERPDTVADSLQSIDE
jgi:pimeloyl-ACP methyl ester carboxylesterase